MASRLLSRSKTLALTLIPRPPLHPSPIAASSQSLHSLASVARSRPSDPSSTVSSSSPAISSFLSSRSPERFLPSEFGIDPARMGHALAPGRVTFDDKMVVRKATENAGIPFTYVSANCFAGYFVGGLCQPGHIVPSRENVLLHGDGNVQAVYVDEDDIATYTIKTIDDPRTLNKTLYIRPPENILSQSEVIQDWEKLSGKELEKTSISEKDFLSTLKGLDDYAQQVGLGHYYHVYYEGCTTNFDIWEEGEEASQLYPEVAYIRVKDYLKRYL